MMIRHCLNSISRHIPILCVKCLSIIYLKADVGSKTEDIVHFCFKYNEWYLRYKKGSIIFLGIS